MDAEEKHSLLSMNLKVGRVVLNAPRM